MLKFHQENHDRHFYLRHARTIKGLSLPKQSINIQSMANKYPYIGNKVDRIQSMNEAQPRILIGQDNWPLLVTREVIPGPWHGPVLSRTLLGWVIHGNYSLRQNSTSNQYVCHIDFKVKDELDLLHDLVKSQWKIDTIFDSDTRAVSKEDIRAQAILDATMHRVGDRFETGLIWKDKDIVLPESKVNAMQRLRCTERKMDKNPEFARAYCNKIKDMENKGYIRQLTKEELNFPNDKEWYLPHFGIINPNKKKLRIVFDASAKSNGMCLNDFLLTGPDLYNSLHSILLNFRIRKYAFTADIKEMFLQVLVRKEDRAAQRILYRGMDRRQEPEVYEINVVFFGSTSGPCLAQEAKNKNAREFIHSHPRAVNDILYNHYMDDYLGSADTVEEGKQLVRDIIDIHKKGGFTICNWITNYPHILEDIDESLLAMPISNKILENNLNTSAERILGVWWDPKDDNFCFKTKFEKLNKDLLDKRKRPTKREMLKVVMSIFDPLGFLSNFMIQGKILLQEVWKSKIGWDDEISYRLNSKWEIWIDGLQKISNFKLPRQFCELNREKSIIQLHIFCDASESAYASVAYLRWEEGNIVTISFLTSKTRVAPLKPMSIPRLELQAALAGARLGSNIRKTLQLKISNSFYWSDSKTVLYWIRSESRRFKVFVAQRVGEIQERTNIFDWRYVDSKQNIADDATKLKTEYDFSPENKWLSGPSFLSKSKEHWPKESSENLNKIDLEEK